LPISNTKAFNPSIICQSYGAGGAGKSIICQEGAYLKEPARYIHLNPLRAKIVSDISELNTYAYCGHSVIMDKKKRPWQDMGYVLSFFGKSLSESRKRYLQYVESAIEQGRRPELVGGGLIRSLGGCKAVKNARFSGQDRMKGDHRILGDSAFVMEVLAEAEEKFERFYELKSKGYDLDTIEQKVCRIFGVEPDEIYSKSRQMKTNEQFQPIKTAELRVRRYIN
jgi:putative transposase